MSWSRFITVENLCIAAEVTAALLLLAFSIPEKRAKAKSSADDEGNRALPELARRAFLEEKIAQSLSRLAMLESSRPAVDLAERFNSELSDAELLGWLDRLSGTYNRSFIDIFLKRWLALPSENRVGSFLSMVSLKDYTELVRDSGPVQVELMLREVGNRLKSQFAEHAIVARLPPDRFLILTFDADPSVGVKCLDFASGAAPDSNSAPETQSKPLELITSVVELSDELPTFEDAVSQLETGIDAATQAGAKCFIKQGTQWSSDIPTPPASSRSSSSRTKVSSSPKSSAKPSTVAASAEDVALASSSKTSDPSVTEGSEPNQETAGKSNGGDELNQLESDLLDTSVQSKSADVSAVASNEEIAALFAQIKKNESKDGKLQDAKADDASTVSGDLKVDASSDTVSNKSETDSVSGDDIASLFAAAKASSKPKQESPAPKVTPETKGKSAASKEADDTVSADDIASLFAAAKPASKPKQESPEPKDTPGAKGKSAANKDDDDTVSADDIASLFASAKPASKPKQESPIPKVTPETKGKSAASKDADETVSADDIASLFSAAKPAQASSPIKQSAGIAELDSMSDTASADDISALFQAVQQEKKESRTSTAKPTPAPNTRFAKEIEDLSESATTEDIAELFKAVQSGLGGAKSQEPPSPTPAIEDLEESATADDIAALFSQMKAKG